MTRAKILQTGDLHIGRGRVSWGEQASLERGSLLFDVLYKTAIEHKCQALLIAGDIFDQKNVTNSERELVSRALTKYSEAVPTFVTPGNHDLKSKTSSNLDFLAEITENSKKIPGLHVSFASEPSTWDFPGHPNLKILGLPCPMSEDQEEVDKVIAELDPAYSWLVVGHGTVKGCARNDQGWKPKESDDRGLSLAEASKNKSVAYWAYGDIHKRQKLPTLAPGANGWYAGSPIQMNFGETEDRGVLVVALDKAESSYSYKGKKYVRLDDKGFAPLITVTDEDQLDDLPEKVFLRLAKDLVLPTSRKEQVIKKIRYVDDRSTPEEALSSSVSEARVEGSTVRLESFDPLLADLKDVEKEVLGDLPEESMDEAKKLLSRAVEQYRERTYVS